MSTTFFASEEIIEVDQEQLDQLKQAAMQAPLKRARLCLHHDHSDKVQEMVIAVCQDSYICPHRQMNKSKSYQMIYGDLVVAFFDNLGRTIRKVKMGVPGSGNTFICRFPSSQWHTVVSLSDIVIYVETIAGPYVREETEFATWGPDETDADGIRAFMARITG